MDSSIYLYQLNPEINTMEMEKMLYPESVGSLHVLRICGERK